MHVEAEKQSHQSKPAPDKSIYYTVREIRDNVDELQLNYIRFIEARVAQKIEIDFFFKD